MKFTFVTDSLQRRMKSRTVQSTRGGLGKESLCLVLPVMLDDLEFFEHDFPLLILLGFLVRSVILPSQILLAIDAVDI